MSTYLQLCVKLRQEVLAAGTGPSAVTGQVGEYKRIVDWIAQADEEVQQEQDHWNFMTGDLNFNTVADVGSEPINVPFRDTTQAHKQQGSRNILLLIQILRC